MTHAVESPESRNPDKSRPQEQRGDEAGARRQVAARFLEDIQGTKETGSGKSAALTDTKVTASGAAVETDKNGLVRQIRRADGSEILTNYSNDTNKKLKSFTGIAPDKSKIIYKRDADGDTFRPFAADGKALKNIGTISKAELSANGNTSFLDQNGDKVIVRGNGAVLPVGAGKFDIRFDTEGRINKITPAKEAIAAGANIRSFGYKGKTEELTEIKVESPVKNPGFVFTHSLNEQTKQWECRDQNGHVYESAHGPRALSKDGDLVYGNSVRAGDKILSRVIHPNGMEELQKGATLADSSTVLTTYNETGQLIGVQTFAPLRDQTGNIVKDKNGKPIAGLPGKKYMAGVVDGKARIFESEPLTSTSIIWAEQTGGDVSKGKRFAGEVVFAGPNSPYKKGEKLESRFDLDPKENGEVTYKDQKGALHTEYKDRSQKVTFTDGSLLVTDQQGNTLRAIKDKQNYLDYVWKESASGGRELSQVFSVADGVKKEAWSSSDKVGVIQPDGRFSYEDKDGKLVFIDLDSTITKYQLGKDKQGPTLTPIEVSLTNGAKRVIDLGADIEHPKRIVDTFIDANGRNMQRTFKALPVVTPSNELAAHNQRMQTYQLIEEHLSNSNFNQPGTTPRITVQASVTDLEILKNGDIAATAPMNAKNPFQPFDGMRFQFKAKNMAESIVPKPNVHSPNSMKVVDEDTRLNLAKEKFKPMFDKDISHRLPRADGKAMSADDFLTQYLLLPQASNLQGGQQSAEARANAKSIAAYRYELGYAIVQQQKIDATEALKKK